MTRLVTVLLAVPIIVSIALAAMAEGQTYILKDYMPQTTGSKWTMKTQGRQGDTTITYEIGPAKEIDGKQVMPVLTKDADGALQRGSLESVTEQSYTLFGSIFVPRGQGGQGAAGEPVESLYKPAVVLPGAMTVGQVAEGKTKVTRQGQETETTLKIELAAIESVTVPKGTFGDCLKLVSTTMFGDREMKRTMWYAPGIGIVKTEQAGRNGGTRVAELTDYQLAQ